MAFSNLHKLPGNRIGPCTDAIHLDDATLSGSPASTSPRWIDPFKHERALVLIKLDDPHP